MFKSDLLDKILNNFCLAAYCNLFASFFALIKFDIISFLIIPIVSSHWRESTSFCDLFLVSEGFVYILVRTDSLPVNKRRRRSVWNLY